MRHLAALAVLAAALATPAGAAAPTTAGLIYVQNTGTYLTDAQLADAIPAFQRAVDEYFAPAWNARATLILDNKPPIQAGVPVIQVSDYSDVLFALAYHGVRRDGTPFAKVFAADSADRWQEAFTHELFELLADPSIHRGEHVLSHGWYSLEVSDPVEGADATFVLPGASGAPVEISDFVTERWFNPSLGKGPFDITGHVGKPLELLPDGYQCVWRQGWQCFGSSRARTATVQRRHRIAVFP